MLLTAAAPAPPSEGMIREPFTGREFPENISFQFEGKDYSLSATGTAVRVKYFFKIYGMAHYMEEVKKGDRLPRQPAPFFNSKQPNAQKAVEEIMTNDLAKQITIEYVRDVDGKRLQSVLREGFQINSTPAEYQEILPWVDELCQSFNQPVKKNTQFILRWLPGGTIVYLLNGEEKAVITNPLFARILWSIWLGEKSVVDRGRLVERMVSSEAAGD